MCPSSNDKFCIECKYVEFKKEFSIYICKNPVHGRNLVTKEWINPNCSFARSLSGKCGPQANHFESVKEEEKHETIREVTITSKESFNLRTAEIRQDPASGNSGGTLQDH